MGIPARAQRSGAPCSCSNEVRSGEKYAVVEISLAILGCIDFPIFDWGKGLDWMPGFRARARARARAGAGAGAGKTPARH